MVNKMDDDSQIKAQNLYYIKKVGDTDYFDKEGNVKTRDVHLVFESKQDYTKVRLIDKMFKTYFILEEKYFKTKKYLLEEQLKEMIMKLKEQDEMIVLSDQVYAFRSEFKYIDDFLSNRMKLKLPPTPGSLIIYDSGDEQDIKEDIKEDEIKNKKYHRYIRKVVKLLEEKIYHK